MGQDSNALSHVLDVDRSPAVGPRVLRDLELAHFDAVRRWSQVLEDAVHGDVLAEEHNLVVAVLDDECLVARLARPFAARRAVEGLHLEATLCAQHHVEQLVDRAVVDVVLPIGVFDDAHKRPAGCEEWHDVGVAVALADGEGGWRSRRCGR
jgi:hypothetical protein